MFWNKIRKHQYAPANPCVFYIKVGFKGVYISFICFPDGLSFCLLVWWFNVLVNKFPVLSRSHHLGINQYYGELSVSFRFLFDNTTEHFLTPPLSMFTPILSILVCDHHSTFSDSTYMHLNQSIFSFLLFLYTCTSL